MPALPCDKMIETIIGQLAAYAAPNVFNPWRDTCVLDAQPSAPEDRRKRLALHLSAPDIRWLLVGEAAGYQGCRYSGVTFTSERLLLDNVIPRISAPAQRLTTRRLAFSEPSATIVWGGLRAHGLESRVVMWNAFPWHPFKSGKPLSNRTPTERELESGRPLLEQLLGLYPEAALVAVGRKAADTLRKLGQAPAAELRHPAMGGATAFRTGLANLAASVQP